MQMRPPAWIVAFCLLGVLGPAVPGPSSGEEAVRHARVRPLHNEDGTLARGERNQMFSFNWSGYEVAQYQTGQTYASAQATWTVPKLLPQSNAGIAQYSTTWVGIGGFCTDAGCTGVDTSLIQLGTEQDIVSLLPFFSYTQYYAWYELLPAGMVLIPRPVRPGDAITASLACTANCAGAPQTWTLTMTNDTKPRKWTWSTSVQYASSMLSAEWIEEAPSSSTGTTLPLANFGTAEFWNAGELTVPNDANGAPLNPPLADGNAIIMLDLPPGQAFPPYPPWGQTSTPAPIPPATGLAHFNACWGYYPNFTYPCSPLPSM